MYGTQVQRKRHAPVEEPKYFMEGSKTVFPECYVVEPVTGICCF